MSPVSQILAAASDLKQAERIEICNALVRSLDHQHQLQVEALVKTHLAVSEIRASSSGSVKTHRPFWCRDRS